VTPIYKAKGLDRKLTSSYRPISLTSCIGKLLESVLCNRLTTTSESVPWPHDEQGGFRQKRRAEDQLFILTEILSVRKELNTYCAFLDVSRAYDVVWRDGLWSKLFALGVDGKLWRMLRAMYSSVESSVRIGSDVSLPFSSASGLRQGSVLSPLLYVLFVNDLITHLKALNIGVRITDEFLAALFFADDMVLIAESRADLLKLLAAASRFAFQWKFEFSASKSHIVVFGPSAIRDLDRTWKLGHLRLEEKDSYCYLGVHLSANMSWSQHIETALTKAKGKVASLAGMGLLGRRCPLTVSRLLVHSLVLSALERSSELQPLDIRGGITLSGQLDAWLTRVCRFMLAVHGRANNDGVLAACGFYTMRVRRAIRMVKFFGYLLRLPQMRWVRRVLDWSMAIRDGNKDGLSVSKWMMNVRALVLEYSLCLDFVHHASRWDEHVKDRIESVELVRWQTRCAASPRLSFFAAYRQVGVDFLLDTLP